MTAASAAAQVPQVPEHPRVRAMAWMAAIVVLGSALALLPLAPAIGVLVVLASIALALARPSWALALVFAAIPLEFVVLDVGFVGLSAVQIALLLVAALMGVEMLATGRLAVPRTPLDVPIFVWAAVLCFGAINAVDPAATIKKAGMTLVLVAVFYFVVAKTRRVATVTRLMQTLVAACTAVAAYGIWFSYRYLGEGIVTGKRIIVGSEGLAVPRASRTVGDPTLMAGLMVLAIPIAIMLVVMLRGWRRWLALGASAVILGGLGFTFTRGAWLGAAFGLAALALEKRTHKVLVVLAIATVLLAPGEVWDRVASSTQFGRAEISHRFDYWEGALLIAEQRPLFGVGVNNFQYAFARLPVPATAQRTAIHSHNVVLMLLSETGLFGLLSFGTFIAGTLVLLLRRRREDPCDGRRMWRAAIAASLLGSLAHQMTDTFLLEPTVNAIVWVFAGLAVAMAAGRVDEFDPLKPITECSA